MKKKIQKSRGKSRFTDLVGIDFSTTETKVVRLKKSKSKLCLVGIDLLPAVDFKSPSRCFKMPRNMLAHYGCLAYSGTAAMVRMVKSPLPDEQSILADEKLRELLNVGRDYQVSATVAKRGVGRQDSYLLAAAIPQDDVQFLLNMFSSGDPAAASLEVAGLSFISAFQHARGTECENEAVCLIESGESASYFSFLNQGKTVLVGKFEVGGAALRKRVAEDLGIDDDLAGAILTDQSVDISSIVQEVIAPFLKQLSISKDFVERREGCRISKVYVSGGMSLIPHWASLLEPMIQTEVVHWSPFENIQYDSNILPESLMKQSTRFAAAVGAAIGGLERL